MKNIYLFRHGQTDWNKQGRFQGIVDIELNETGLSQAKCVPVHLKDKGIKAIYSSPMKRALKTGQITAKELGIDIVIHKDLYEVNLGDVAGKTEKEVEENFGKGIWEKWQGLDPENDNISFPNSETKIQFRKRIYDAILDIASSTEHDTIGISTHGFVMKQFLVAIGEMNCRGTKNCEIFHLSFDKNINNNLQELNKSFKLIKRIRTDI